MIWDRFDDAHDDLLGDIREEERRIQDLETRLEKSGIFYEPYKKPIPENKSGPQGWYEDTQSENFALTRYRGYLEQLLENGAD